MPSGNPIFKHQHYGLWVIPLGQVLGPDLGEVAIKGSSRALSHLTVCHWDCRNPPGLTRKALQSLLSLWGWKQESGHCSSTQRDKKLSGLATKVLRVMLEVLCSEMKKAWTQKDCGAIPGSVWAVCPSVGTWGKCLCVKIITLVTCS